MPRKLLRQPLAFGMQKWGPLPGSSCYLLWGGPGLGLMFCTHDPEDATPLSGKYIEHPSANGIYFSVETANAAAQAFAAAGMCGRG